MCISEIGNFKKYNERPLHASMLMPSILSVDEDTEKLVMGITSKGGPWHVVTKPETPPPSATKI